MHRAGSTTSPFRIIVGVDYSPASKLALDQALRLAAEHGGQVLAVQVLPDRGYDAEAFLRAHKERRDKLDRYCHARRDSLLAEHVGPTAFELDAYVRYGSADEQLRRFAKRVLAALMVVGQARDRSRWQRALRPPVADSLVSDAPCPVLVARPVQSGTFYVGELLGLAPPHKRSA
jgi:nucleotide-binding universal stress UspA family protein